MRIGLKMQLTVLAIVLVSLSIGVSSYFFTRQEREVLFREMTRRGITIARNLATIATDSLVANDNLSLATFVDSVMRNEGMSYGMILNDKGIILAHNRIGNVGKTYTEPTGVRPISNEEILIQPYRSDSGEKILDIALPISLRNGIRVGVARIGMSQDVIQKLVDQAFIEVLWIAAGLLLIAVLITIFFTGLLLKPLEGLMRGVNAIGEGNLSFKIPVKGNNEIAILARSFNDMAAHLRELYIGILRAMAKALEARDKFTAGHDQRVSEYAAACASHIGRSAEEVDNIRLAAQVQNLGHIAVPDAILEKTGKLSPEEYGKLKEHTQVGAEILNQVPALAGAVPLVLHHHERFDGTGYPRGIKGKDIPLGARILAVADAFDAMTSNQRHHQAMSRALAVEELKRGAGSQFDPEIVDAFIESLHLMSHGTEEH